MNKHPYTPLTPPSFLLCFLSLLNYNEFFLSRENAKYCASRSSCAKLFPINYFFSVSFLKFRFCNASVVTWQIVFFKQTWRRLVLKEVVRSSASKRRKISRSSNASQFMTLTSFAYQNGLGDKTLTHSLSVKKWWLGMRVRAVTNFSAGFHLLSVSLLRTWMSARCSYYGWLHL